MHTCELTDRRLINRKWFSLLILAVGVLVAMGVPICADDIKPVNLARLSIAKVYASSGRKGAKGVQKLFDGSNYED